MKQITHIVVGVGKQLNDQNQNRKRPQVSKLSGNRCKQNCKRSNPLLFMDKAGLQNGHWLIAHYSVCNTHDVLLTMSTQLNFLG